MNLDEFVTQSKIQHLRRELRANPSNAEVKVVLATLLWRGNSGSSNEPRSKLKARREESLALFEEAHRLNPQCAETCNELALKYKATGKLDKAKEMLQKSLVVSNGTFCRAFRNMAILAKEEGDIDKSKEYLLRAVEADPNDTASWFNLGRLIFDATMSSTTITTTTTASSSSSSSSQSEEEEIAISAIHSSLSCDPYNYAALLWLGRYYSRKYLEIQTESTPTRVSSTVAVVVTSSTPLNITNNNNNNNNIRARLNAASADARRGEYLVRSRQYFLQALNVHPFEAECYDAFGDYLATCIEDFPSAIRCYRYALGCSATVRPTQQKQIQEKILGYIGKMKENFEKATMMNEENAGQSSDNVGGHHHQEDYDIDNNNNNNNNNNNDDNKKNSINGTISSSSSKKTKKKEIVFNPEVFTKKFESEMLAPIPVPAMLHFTAVEKRPNPFCFTVADEKISHGKTIDFHDSLETYLAIATTKTKNHHHHHHHHPTKRSTTSSPAQATITTKTSFKPLLHSNYNNQQQENNNNIHYWSSPTQVRCALGHQMFLVRTKPYFGFNAWSCDSCSKTITASDAEKHGTYHCPLPCDCDICPCCIQRWTKGIQIANDYRNQICNNLVVGGGGEVEKDEGVSTSLENHHHHNHLHHDHHSRQVQHQQHQQEEEFAFFAEGGHIGYWNEKKRRIRFFHPASSSSSPFVLPNEKDHSSISHCLLMPTSVSPVTDEKTIDFLSTIVSLSSSSSSSSSSNATTAAAAKLAATGFISVTYQLPKNVVPLFSLVDQIYGDYPLHRGLHEFEVRAIMFHLLGSLKTLQEHDFALGSICPSSCFVILDDSSSDIQINNFSKKVVKGASFLAVTGLHQTFSTDNSQHRRFPLVFGTRNAHTFIAPEALPGRFEKRSESHRSTLNQMLVSPQPTTTSKMQQTEQGSGAGSGGGQFPSSSSSSAAASSFSSSSIPLLSPLQSSDMWSISCLWMYLLTGTRPYKSLNSLTVRGYSRTHLPTIPFVISTFLSVYKIGRSPFNLERMKTIFSTSLWNLIFPAAAVSPRLNNNNNSSINNSSGGAVSKELFGVSSTTRWTPKELLEQEYFKIFFETRSNNHNEQPKQQMNPLADPQQQQSSPVMIITNNDPSAIFCPWPANVDTSSSSSDKIAEQMENSQEYHIRTKFRFMDLASWYNEPPSLEEALVTLNNHAFFADSPPVNVAWLVAAHSLTKLTNTTNSSNTNNNNDNSDDYMIRVRLPPLGLCVHEEIIAGEVVEGGKYLQVTKLDCLRYALGRGNISNAVVISNWNKKNRNSAHSTSHVINKKISATTIISSPENRSNNISNNATTKSSSSVELFLEPSVKELLRKQRSTSTSFCYDESGSQSMMMMSQVKTTHWTKNNNNDENYDDQTRKEEVQQQQQPQTFQVHLVFADRNDAVDIVYGVRKLLQIQQQQQQQKSQKSKNDTTSPRKMNFEVVNLDVTHSHGMILEATTTMMINNNDKKTKTELISLRDLVYRVGPLDESLVSSFFAPEILRMLSIDDDDEDEESSSPADTGDDDDDNNDVLSYLNKKCSKKSISPDSIFCKVETTTITNNNNNTTDDDNNQQQQTPSATTSSFLHLHTDRLYCLSPFAAATPLIAFDIAKKDFREKLTSMAQSDSIFHFAILISWLLLGGYVDSVAEDAFNSGWVSALGNVFLNHGPEIDGISPDLLNLLRVCVSDVSTRKPSVGDVLNQFVSAASPSSQEVNNNNNSNNNNSAIVKLASNYTVWSRFEQLVTDQLKQLMPGVNSKGKDTSSKQGQNKEKKQQQQQKDDESSPSSLSPSGLNAELTQELQLRKQEIVKKFSPQYQHESISFKQFMKFWTDEAHRIRIAPQIFTDSKHFRNVVSPTALTSTSSTTTTLLEWFIHSGDAFDKVCLAVEGYGDTLAILTLLMLSNYGSLSPHRLWLSNPDDARFLVKKNSLMAEDSALKGNKHANPNQKKGNSKNASKHHHHHSNSKKDKDKDDDDDKSLSSSFSMIRFFQESAETSPDELLHTLTKYGGVDAAGKRFIFLRDNDLKVVTPSNKLGTFEAFDTTKKWTYYHRLRFGRAIENYLLPFYGPLALLQRDPKVTFALTVSAWATFSLQFFPAFILPSVTQSIKDFNNSNSNKNTKAKNQPQQEDNNNTKNEEDSVSADNNNNNNTNSKFPLLVPIASSGFYPGRCGEAWIGWQDEPANSAASTVPGQSSAPSAPAGGSALTSIIFSQQTVKKACRTRFDADLIGFLYHRMFRGNFYDLKKSEIDDLLISKDSKLKMQQKFHPLLNEFEGVFPEHYYLINNSKNNISDDKPEDAKSSNTNNCVLLDDLEKLYANAKKNPEASTGKVLTLIEVAQLVNPPIDKTTGKTLADPLAWTQLPQFLNYLTTLLSTELLLFQSVADSKDQTIEEWSEEFFKARSAAPTTKKQAVKGRKIQYTPAEEAARRMLPKLLRDTIRKVLHTFHLAMWMLHLGDVSTSVVEFGVTKMFSLRGDKNNNKKYSCEGLLLGLNSEYTPRKMLDEDVFSGLLASSSTTAAAEDGSSGSGSTTKKTELELCLDSLCLNCGRPVREHDGYFKKFLFQQTASTSSSSQKPLSRKESSSHQLPRVGSSSAMFSSVFGSNNNNNNDDDTTSTTINDNSTNNNDIELFLESLCLFGTYAWDSHPMTEYLHGREKCLAENLENYLEMPHSMSPGMIANTLATVEERTSGNNNNNNHHSGNSNQNRNSSQHHSAHKRRKSMIIGVNAADVMKRKEALDDYDDDTSSSSTSSDSDEENKNNANENEKSSDDDYNNEDMNNTHQHHPSSTKHNKNTTTSSNNKALTRSQKKKLENERKRAKRKQQRECNNNNAQDSPEEDRRKREELQLREEIHAQHMIVSLGNGFIGGSSDPSHATGCACCNATCRDAQKLIHGLRRVPGAIPSTEREYYNSISSNNNSNRSTTTSSSSLVSKDHDLRCFLQQSSSAKELLKVRQQELLKFVFKVKEACVFQDTPP